jgi:septal ring factor EnvC (AmiA/AmiB activator)
MEINDFLHLARGWLAVFAAFPAQFIALGALVFLLAWRLASSVLQLFYEVRERKHQRQIKGLNAQIGGLNTQLGVRDKRIRLAEEKVNEVDANVARLESQIWELKSQIALNVPTDTLSQAASTIQSSVTALSTANTALHEVLKPELFPPELFQ